MNRSLIALSLFALVGAVGCGGTDLGTDDFGTTEGPDLAGAHLMAGTYNVSNIVKVTDACGLVFEGDAANQIDPLKTLQLLNTGTMLSLGNMYGPTTDPKYNPAGYSAGTGPYTTTTMATLTTQTQVTLADGCTYAMTRTSNATFTGNNQMSVDFTDVETGHTGCTVANGEPTMDCTSHYTFDLKM